MEDDVKFKKNNNNLQYFKNGEDNPKNVENGKDLQTNKKQPQTIKSKNNGCGTAPGNMLLFFYLHQGHRHWFERLACAVTELSVH
jgi:hypothetical protein